MEDEHYSCSNVDCSYTHYEKGECPYCGTPLKKISGEQMQKAEGFENEDTTMPPVTEFDDDPDMWYADEREPLETM